MPKKLPQQPNVWATTFEGNDDDVFKDVDLVVENFTRTDLRLGTQVELLLRRQKVAQVHLQVGLMLGFRDTQVQ